MNEKDGGDTELCLFAMTLINKVVRQLVPSVSVCRPQRFCPSHRHSIAALFQILSGIPDQDTFYDITDYLEEQGMESIVQRHMSRNGADLDLISQLNIYERALKAEDGDDTAGGSSDIR